jgi:hypothetical protein
MNKIQSKKESEVRQMITNYHQKDNKWFAVFERGTDNILIDSNTEGLSDALAIYHTKEEAEDMCDYEACEDMFEVREVKITLL